MFSVTVDNKEYKVEFQHFNPINYKVDESNYSEDFGTDCFIIFDKEHIGIGSTVLHPYDFHSYNKNTGRKMSLHRALCQAFLGEDNKETRRKFWQAYYVARGNKW